MSNPTSPLDLGTLPVSKLLKQYAFPAIVAMTASSLYNMVDSIFIGHGVGPLAISGLALTFPFMNLSAAFGAMVGIGASTLISVRLGQQDYKAAQDIFGNVVTLTLILGVLFSIVALVFLDPILSFFGASSETLPYARDFMQIILLGTPVTFTMIGLNHVMRATGHPKKAMLTSLATVVFNVILAPLFIFKLGWGIRGAALATLLSQMVGTVWVLNHFLQPSNPIRLHRHFWKMERRIVGSIFSIGMSPFLMNVTACVIVIIINNSLQEHGGDMAIGAYGIINRLLMLYVMIVMGLTMGMQPIVGYNFGAQKTDRVKRTLRLGIISGVCITSSGFVICELFPHAVASVFTSDDALINMAAHGVRICVAVFPLIGAQMVIGNFFQSIGKAKVSIFMSLTRQLLYLLPGLVLLPPHFGLDGIWMSMPISVFFAFVTAAVILWWYIRKLKRQHREATGQSL